MSDLEEQDFLDRLREGITEGTDEDYIDFWAQENPSEFLMNDRKLEEANG